MEYSCCFKHIWILARGDSTTMKKTPSRVFFSFRVTATLPKIGGGEGSWTPVLRKNRKTFYILSILLISFQGCLNTGYLKRILLKAFRSPQLKRAKRPPSEMMPLSQPTGLRATTSPLITQREQIRYYLHLILSFPFYRSRDFGMLIFFLFYPVESGTPPWFYLFI